MERVHQGTVFTACVNIIASCLLPLALLPILLFDLPGTFFNKEQQKLSYRIRAPQSSPLLSCL